MLLDRLYVPGPAYFYPHAFHSGWAFTVVLAGCCWTLQADDANARPRAPTLLALIWLQAMVVQVLTALLYVPASHLAAADPQGAPGGTASSWLPALWSFAALLTLAARGATAPSTRRIGALSLLLLAMAYTLSAGLPAYWYAESDSADGPERYAAPPLRPEQFEAQPRLLAEQTAALVRERPGIVDVYAITFAPYAEEDVFLRESALVTEVMSSRFDAAGRTLQLLNHRSTLETHALATPRNLRRAIEAAAARMNLDEDILFIHLTSHGAADGELSARFASLAIDAVQPGQVKEWLDAAGVKRRIVSVSACYSGSWIAPLADERTLVMTAADAKNTSYGCGRRSPLTFFGRAMFDEQLRSTWSFEQAHAAARAVIEQREREAGKTDGYSNPQLHIGRDMRPVLARLEGELAARTKP